MVMNSQINVCNELYVGITLASYLSRAIGLFFRAPEFSHSIA